MKVILLFPLVLFFSLSPLTAQKKLVFSYDASGNQILRNLVAATATAPAADDALASDLTAELPEGLKTQRGEFQLTAYPNPIISYLVVAWNLDPQISPRTLILNSSDGKRLNIFNIGAGQNQQVIDFQNYPSGIYVLNIQNRDDSKQTIKVIKN